MKIEYDEFGDWFTTNGEEFGPSADGEFEVLTSRIREARLVDLPRRGSRLMRSVGRST